MDQNAPVALQDELVRRVLALEGVMLGESWISVPGARAFHIESRLAAAEPEAFFGPTTEFAHVHPAFDGSLHAKLPHALALAAIEAGWAEPHPMAARRGPPITNVMLYGPRDGGELETVFELVRCSYRFARGLTDLHADPLDAITTA